jgi:hypothetical protein
MTQPNLIIISSFSLIPYLVVAWGYRDMTEVMLMHFGSR